MASPVCEVELVENRAVERRGRGNDGRVLLAHEEEIAAAGAGGGGNVLGKIGAARNELGAGGSIDAVSASAENGIVAARNKGDGRRLTLRRRGQAGRSIGEARRGYQPIDHFMAGGPGDAEHGGSGGGAIVRRGPAAGFLARFLPRGK